MDDNLCDETIQSCETQAAGMFRLLIEETTLGIHDEKNSRFDQEGIQIRNDHGDSP
jgi:hypothetical protein